MLRGITVTLAATLAVALSACGSGDDAGDPGVSAESAKASIERAADVKLAAEPIPDEARDQGLRASFSNSATVAEDRQVVFLFLMKDGGVANKVKETVKGSVPEPSKVIVNGKVLVIYGSDGRDHAAQVENAVQAL